MFFLPYIIIAVLAYVAHKSAEKAFFWAVALFHVGLFFNFGQNADVSAIRVVIAAFLVFFIVMFFKGKIKIKKEPIVAALTAFLLIASLSLFYADNFSFGIRKLAYFLSMLPFYFVVRYFVDSAEKAKKLLKINIIMAGAVSFFGAAQFLAQFFVPLESIKRFFVNIHPFIYGRSFGALVVQTPSWFVNIGGRDFFRSISIFPDPHTYALYLGLIVPLAAAALYFDLFKERWVIWASFILSVFSLITTFSRGGYVSLFVLPAVFLIFNYKNIPKDRFLAGGLAALAVVVLLAVSPAGARFRQSFDIRERSVSGRLQIMAGSLSLWKDNFIFGVGVGNYAPSAEKTVSYRTPVNAHNTYLEIATEMGVLGLAAWLFLVFASVFGLIAFLKKNNNNEKIEYFAIGLGTLAGLLCFFVNGLFEAALYWPVVLVVFVENVAVAGFLLFKDKNA